MLHLQLAGPRTSLAEGRLLDQVAAALTAAGHEVHEAPPTPDLGESDGVLVVADGYVPESCAAALGHARGAGRLALLVHTAPSTLQPLATHARLAATLEETVAAAVAIAKDASPHAGRLVRDQVPRLVREAGHAVRFREAAPDERPLLLKRKIAEHARALERAGLPDEKEEATDLLEALEALIRTRTWDREELRLLKAAKLKRRGGFERGFVVDGAGPIGAADAPDPQAVQSPAPIPATAPAPATVPAPVEAAPTPALPPAPPPVAPSEAAPAGLPAANPNPVPWPIRKAGLGFLVRRPEPRPHGLALPPAFATKVPEPAPASTPADATAAAATPTVQSDDGPLLREI